MKVAIAGVGKLGLKIAQSLLQGDYEITIIDKNPDVLSKLSQQLDVMTIEGDARNIEVLKSMEIESFDYLLALTHNDELNIVITAFAKKLGCHHVIARVREPEHMNQVGFIKESMNIDYIINPDLAITVEIYKYLAEKYTLKSGIFTSGLISLIEFPAKKYPKIVNKNLPEVKTLMSTMIIVAISRNGKVIIPHGDDIIQENDTVYVVGEKSEITELSKKVHDKVRNTKLQKVMIIGGGKTGFYLAEKLSDFGASVKLIESDMERCRYLSTHLENVMVLHGNGTDMDLLEEENFEQMDAFVTATGHDEDNLLLALTAKQHGIEDVISKVSHIGYKGLIEHMGVDMALNPLDITAVNILKFIQGEKRIISSVLLQGQAEIMEVIAHSHMTLINKELSELDLPEGMLIGAIHRGTKVIIPDGNTTIESGDRVLIVCHLSEISNLEKLLKFKK